ncbi:eukaryotic translation initiation factor 3 subunit E-like protein [Dinothrombium tinctorium]|uniref:Eukaryotic translation initiation factor 3 subunit E n=1 Tax=Dinothrombium tinctorium TaxID=1965070 RepID=A0A3S3P1Z9_9ACAR|nr:eukaryotic translation initiation factor 3 subunit E-like protein [Dinothrombium tinctorium]
MAKWELTSRLGKFLDRHLVLTLLEFLSSNQIYDEKELLLGKLEMLKNTNMIDFAIDVYKKLYPDQTLPAEFFENRQRVVAELKELETQTQPVLAILVQDDVSQQIATTRDSRQLFDYLKVNHGLTSEMVDSLYKSAKFQYECGNYSGAAQYLSSHRLLVSPNDKNYLSNLWGKLASEILMQQWENALEDFNRLRDYIDNYPYFTPLQLLQQRTWLIHWSLFIYFNHTQGKDMLIDMFLERKAPFQKQQQPYLNAVQTICPHIIRYLTTAVITHRRRREYMKELVKVIQQESYTYRDPITEFVECLCVNFDFDGAQKKLRECVDVFNNDFFLIALQDEFIENARLFVFEIFCQIHECISINMLADKLNMTPEEAERWIVNLIRQARLDAKIDSKLGHVVMGTQAVSPYQQLIEKTKAMAIRCHVLTMNIEKRLQTPERAQWGVTEI